MESNKIHSHSLLQCPFDPHHQVAASRFALHLAKCNSPNRHNFTRCDYNTSHCVPVGQMDSHLANCQSYQLYLKALAANQTILGPPPQPSSGKQSELPESNSGDPIATGVDNSVDWDSLTNPATFRPLNPFQLNTLTKSEKRKYRTLLAQYNSTRL